MSSTRRKPRLPIRESSGRRGGRPARLLTWLPTAACYAAAVLACVYPPIADAEPMQEMQVFTRAEQGADAYRSVSGSFLYYREVDRTDGAGTRSSSNLLLAMIESPEAHSMRELPADLAPEEAFLATRPPKGCTWLDRRGAALVESRKETADESSRSVIHSVLRLKGSPPSIANGEVPMIVSDGWVGSDSLATLLNRASRMEFDERRTKMVVYYDDVSEGVEAKLFGLTILECISGVWVERSSELVIDAMVPVRSEPASPMQRGAVRVHRERTYDRTTETLRLHGGAPILSDLEEVREIVECDWVALAATIPQIDGWKVAEGPIRRLKVLRPYRRTHLRLLEARPGTSVPERLPQAKLHDLILEFEGSSLSVLRGEPLASRRHQ